MITNSWIYYQQYHSEELALRIQNKSKSVFFPTYWLKKKKKKKYWPLAVHSLGGIQVAHYSKLNKKNDLRSFRDATVFKINYTILLSIV